MPIAQVVIHKQQGGHKWSNTHGVIINGAASGVPAEADMNIIGADTPFTDANTGASPAARFLHALVAFERQMHYADVQFTDIYVTDGRKNVAGQPTIYFTSSLVGAGLSNFAGVGGAGVAVGANLLTGTVCWLLHRNVVGMGHKPGRLYLRGCLPEGAVISNGPRMLSWGGGVLDNSVPNTYVGTAQGKITPYLAANAQAATATYAVPLYVTPKHPVTGFVNGELYSAIPVSGLSSVGPVAHQVPRGRRKKKAA